MIKRAVIFILILALSLTYIYSAKSPDEFFGLTIGADKTLVKYPDIIKYFTYIDGESDRIRMTEEGKSTLGNSLYLATISSEENLKNLDQLMAINKKLANPDQISETEAKQLIKKAKVFILITCAIHASEIASSQYAMQLAHKLAVTQDPAVKSYLDNTVILLMPSINPDGNIMVTDWYQKNLNTKYEMSRMPWLYHHYAGHDNNRDFYMLNLDESRVVNAVLHHRYYPHIYLDMHQMGSTGPRMFVPPFKDPVNSNLNPLMLRQTDIIGGFMSLKLQEQGKQGVASSYAFDAYWPGGSKNTAWYKNVVGVLTELASTNIASPIYVEPNELRVRSKGLAEYKAQVNFPDPWKGGWWRLQDIIDYESIAVDALIEVAAKNRLSFVSNFYKMGRANVTGDKFGSLTAYVVPAKQWDKPASYTFLQKMKENGVRIFKLEEDTPVGNVIYKAGDFIIPLAQPYGDFVKTMMEIQHYPEIKHMRDGPIIQPYDASGWTMPMQMGVKASELKTPLDKLKLTALDTIPYPATQVSGDGDYYLLSGRYNRSVMAVNRLLKRKIPVERYIHETPVPQVKPGDWLVKASDIGTGDLETLLKGTGVDVQKVTLPGTGRDYVRTLAMPRLAIYQSWRASMDEGWTRYVLDKFEFKYTVLHNRDFLDKKFSKKYDVILFPDMNRSLIVNGDYGAGSYWGKSITPPEYDGGIGEKGLKALKSWVENGGAIVLLDSAAELGIKDFGLPLRNTLEGVTQDKFYCPGAILRLNVDPLDPLGWGMEAENIIYFSRSPAFRTRMPRFPHVDRKVAAGFNETGNHLLSGYLKGGHLLDRAVMIMRLYYHKGKVVVLGGKVQNRAQTYGTFKFLFNAIYYPCLK